ncbi:MAG: hypothetical protein M3R31_12315, partial [Pseudomonadota bacterium]|nr:hypothetical protein [Pseudomonadota bacterium]
MTLRRYLGIGLALVVVLAGALLGAALWFATGESGLGWAVGEAARRSAGRLVFEGATGSLAGQMHVARITYSDEGWQVVADDVDLTWSPRALLSRRLSVAALTASQVRLELRASGGATALPPSLALAWPVDIERVAIGRLDAISGANAWHVRGLALRYHGDTDGHRLDELALDSDWGALQGDLTVGANPPLAAEGNIRFTGSDRLRGAAGEIDIAGDLAALQLALSATGQGAQASASAVVAPFEPVWLRELEVSADDIDLARFDTRLPKTALSVELSGAMAKPSRFEARLEAINAEAGAWSNGRLPLARAATRLAYEADALSFDALEIALVGKGRIRGDASLATDELRGRIRVDDLDLSGIHARLYPTRLAGALDFRLAHTADVPQGAFKGELRERGIALAFDAEIARGELQLKAFRAQAKGGTLAGTGRLELAATHRFSIDAAATRLDPAAFGSYPSASITGTVAAQGALEPGWSAALTLKLAPESRWRNLPLAGGGSIELAREHIGRAALALSVGRNRLQLAGDYGRAGDRLDFSIDAPDLAAVDAGLAGRLNASGRIGGAWARPSLAFTARGEALRFASISAASLVAEGDIGAQGSGNDERPIRISAALTDAQAHSVAVKSLSARVTGTVAQHELVLTARGTDLDLDARLAGGWRATAGAGWSGHVVALENRGQYPLALTGSARVDWRPDHIRIADATGTLSGGRFALRELVWDAGRWTSSGDFSELPAAAVLAAT